MTIYRVETHIGDGPYCGERNIHTELNHGMNIEKHPTIQHDKSLEANLIRKTCERLECTKEEVENMWTRILLQPWTFVFATLSQLTNWFTKSELKMMYAHGFKVYEYSVEANDLVLGNKQVLFRKDSKFTKRKSLKQLQSLLSV